MDHEYALSLAFLGCSIVPHGYSKEVRPLILDVSLEEVRSSSFVGTLEVDLMMGSVWADATVRDLKDEVGLR
jgi:hypothetical protein